MTLLKTQVKIRKKVLNQIIVPITFTRSRRQKPISDIVQELSRFIDQNNTSSELSPLFRDPKAFVGKRIKHKFDNENGIATWYDGTVIGYCNSSKTHKIVYEGEEESCNFDLLVDLLMAI